MTLPADIARCSPSQPCPQQEHCARVKAQITAASVLFMDATVAKVRGHHGCMLFIDERGIGSRGNVREGKVVRPDAAAAAWDDDDKETT